jgi:putative transposase
MTFELIEAERAQHPVSLLCGVLGVTRGGFYAWKRRGRSRRSLADELLGAVIAKVHSESLETYGVPRIHAELADDYAIRVGRKRVARLMRQLGLEGVSRRHKRRYKTTIPAASSQRRRTSSAAPSRRPARTGSGWPTSPTSPPGRASSFSPA